MNRAFTLLELLVVITIIDILSSIVIVSMSGSTDSATIAKGKTYAQQVHALLGYQEVLNFNFNEINYGTCPDGKDVCDASGHGNHGIIYNDQAEYVPSSIDGYALSFNGSSDYVDCGGNNDIVSIIGDLTLEAWIFPGENVDAGVISTHYQKNDFTRPYTLAVWGRAERPSFILGTGTGQIGAYSPTSLDVNNWHHLVGTVFGNDMKLYVNGELKAVNTFSGTRQTGKKLVIGSDSDSNFTGRMFNGLIDEVHIYSLALSPTEIQKYYAQGLKKLLSNQAITQAEYDQRMGEFKKVLASSI